MSFWNNHPGVRLVIPFLFGIIASIELGFNSPYTLFGLFLVLLISGITFVFSSFKNKVIIGVIYFLSIFTVAFLYTSFRTEKYAVNHFSNYHSESKFILATVADNLQPKQNSYKTTLKITQLIGDSNIVVLGRVLAYIRKDSTTDLLHYGDEILLKNKLNFIESNRNPNQFDYTNYLNLNQINFQVFLSTEDFVSTGNNSGNWLIAFSQKMRQKLYSYLEQNGVEGKQLKVASALLLGYKENLDKDLQKSYASAGAMHVLAVSGLHVGILYLLLSRILSLIKRVKQTRFLVALLIISCLWFYAIMTGLSASVMRATTMFSFIVIGDKLMNQKVSIYNTLAVSAILLMVFNPYIIYQVGFQLSYAAVVGIVYLQPKLNRLFYSKYKIVRAIWAITCVSIAAQIATFPLSLHYFHQFPTYFFISNLVVIPAAFLVFYLGVFLFVSAPFGGVSLVIGKLINGIIWVLNQAVYLTEDLPKSVLKEIEFSVFETYLLYLITITFLVSFYNRKIKTLYLGFSFILLFIGLQLFQHFNSTQQEYLTFYSINKYSALDYTIGNTSYFLASKELQEDWSMMLFNVDNHWNSHNILNKIQLNFDSLPTDTSFNNLMIYNGLIVTETLVIWIFDKENIPNIIPDIVWVKNDKLSGLSRYLKENTPKTIVFDSSVPKYKQKYYKDYIDTQVTEKIDLHKTYHKINLN